MALLLPDDELAERIRACVLELLIARGPGRSICPSEAARMLAMSTGAHWQDLMRPVRTVAAAMEGLALGIPSIAVSQAYTPGDRNTIRWDCAESHAPGIIRRLLEEGIPEGVLFNLNFPNAGPSEVEGVSVTVQGRRDQELVKLEPRKDGRGNPYYWIAFQRSRKEPANGTDLRAMAEKRISVTPLELDLTHEPTLTRFTSVLRSR